MTFNHNIWWDNLFGPASLVRQVKNVINNKKNILIKYDNDIPWEDYFFSLITGEHYDYIIDFNEIDLDDVSDDISILREILKRNGLENQYKGEKNSIKYLDQLTCDFVKLYYIKNINDSRIEELTNLMKCMSNRSKVLILATTKIYKPSSGQLWTIKYNDYISFQDNIRLLKLLSETNKYSSIICDYIAELIGRIEPSLEKAINIFSNYQLGKTINFDVINENEKKVVWEAQLLIFFPILEKKRNEFVIKYYKAIKDNLPITDIFDNVYYLPEELEIGHIWRLIFTKKISVSSIDYDNFKLYHDMRNNLSHQRVINELDLKKLI